MFTEIQKSCESLFFYLRTKSKKYSLPRWTVFVQDMGAVFITFLFAYLLRYNLSPSGFSILLATRHALLTLLVYATFSLLFKPYAGIIRHTTIKDIFNVFIANTLSLATLAIITLLQRWYGWGEYFNIPLSILLIHYVCITSLLLLVRISIKMLYELISSPNRKKKNTLIYGAGAMGVIVKQVIVNDSQSGYHIAGFLDDSRSLQHKKINGIPIYSPRILKAAFLTKNNITCLIFAIKEISPKRKSQIIRSALDLGLEVLETPAVETWMYGQLQVEQFRKVKLEDLLGREPIKLDMGMIEKGLAGKTILVTGAAGSIGSEIVRQLARFTIDTLVLVDQAETPMFHLERELKEKYPGLPVQLLIADVTHAGKMELIFSTFQPDIVFHAAAYKHVPLMEENPHEAFRVNVGGTRVITALSASYNVEKFVMISTDKAVNPTNVMGASKRVCELIVQSTAQQPGMTTQFVITRFGNVLGSNGSVIPLFMKQIEKGGPITITHPEITRYFMTIPEACELVLEAGFMGKGGEIFVFDMGKPVKIADLANQMIRLSGLVPGKDIKIEYVGLRPGEKLYEELLADKEITQQTHHPKIRIARVNNIDRKMIQKEVDAILSALYSLTEQEIVEFLNVLVPEYTATKFNWRRKLQRSLTLKLQAARTGVQDTVEMR